MHGRSRRIAQLFDGHAPGGELARRPGPQRAMEGVAMALPQKPAAGLRGVKIVPHHVQDRGVVTSVFRRPGCPDRRLP